MAASGVGALFRFFGNGTVRLFGSFFKIRFFFLFTFFLILNGFLIGFTDGPDAALNDLGERFLSPLQKVHEKSIEIKEEGLIFVESKNIFQEIFGIWELLSNFWIIYLELIVLAFLVKKFIIWDDSKGGTALVISLILYLGIQMLYLSSLGDSVWYPFTMLKEITLNLPNIFEPVANFGDSLYISPNVTDVINVSKNITT